MIRKIQRRFTRHLWAGVCRPAAILCGKVFIGENEFIGPGGHPRR